MTPSSSSTSGGANNSHHQPTAQIVGDSECSESTIIFNFDSDSDPLSNAAPKQPNNFLNNRTNGGITRHCSRILTVMNAMRKQRDFCDVTIITQEMPLRAHKAVLAAASPVLMEMFHKRPVLNSNSLSVPLAADHRPEEPVINFSGGIKQHLTFKETLSVYTMPKIFEFDTMETLIEYVYTGKLEIKREKFESVYLTADRLQMQPVLETCSKYLINSINMSNCLAVRKLLWEKTEYVETVNEFIRDNFEEITQKHREFDRLQRLEMVLKGNPIGASICDERLVRNILRWFSGHVQEGNVELKHLSQTKFILSIDSAKCRTRDDVVSDEFKREVLGRKGIRIECNEISSTEFIQLEHDRTPPSKNGGSTVSFDLVHMQQNTDHNIIGLCMIRTKNETKDRLRRKIDDPDYTDQNQAQLVSFLLTKEWGNKVAEDDDEIVQSTKGTNITNTQNDISSADNANGSIRNHHNLPPSPKTPLLPPLPMVRGGFGLVLIEDTVIVCGGFNSGSCFRSVEYCDVAEAISNGTAVKWVSSKPELRFRRARGYAFFSGTADRRGFLYAVSGGDGTKILASVEKVRTPLKPDGRGSWMTDNSISVMHEKASFLYTPGGSKLYSFGGLQNSLSTATRRCFVNRLVKNEDDDKNDEKWAGWQAIASMSQARYDASVISEDCDDEHSRVFVFGGSEGFVCSNSCEVYDPRNDSWETLPPMPECNRCCGLAKKGDEIYVLGGTNGTETLSHVHIFNVRSLRWSRGPSLNTRRSSFGVACIRGLLHVFGGFDGKQFLRSVEVLDPDLDAWTVVSEISRRQQQQQTNGN